MTGPGRGLVLGVLVGALAVVVPSRAVEADAPARGFGMVAPSEDAATPPPVHTWAMRRLARADELLRHKRTIDAAELFIEVYEGVPGTVWAGFAELGLAWTAVAESDLDGARLLTRDALPAAGAATDAANLLVALLDGAAGRTAEAASRLTTMIRARSGTPHVVARLARGYVHYWGERFADSLTDFEAVVAAPDAGDLVDDARYGAAWVRVATGDPDAGTAALRAIVTEAPAGRRVTRVPWALVDLEAEAILQDSFRRYQSAGRQMPAQQVARLLDADGVARAHTAIRLLDVDEPTRQQAARSAALARAAGAEGHADAAASRAATASGDGRARGDVPADPAAPRPARWRGGAILLVLGCLLALVWRMRSGRGGAALRR